MRLFFFFLLCSWVVGIVVGATGANEYALLFGGFAVGCIVAYFGFREHIVCASIVLFLLGSLWGVDRISSESCFASSPFEGVITSVHRVYSDRASYVVDSREGCSILVATVRFPEMHSGDTVRVDGDVQSVFDMPDELASYASYLMRNDIFATTRYADVQLIDRSMPLHAHIRQSLRYRIGEVFLEPEASLVHAMVLAERGMVSDELHRQFRASGVAHVLAISGLHISLLAGIVLGVMHIVPFPTYIRFVLSVSVLWGYVVFIGAPVSAVRAAVFWSLFLTAKHMRVLVSLPTVFILAFSGLVTYDPRIIFDVGFQLSFAAVVGIGVALFLAKPYVRDARYKVVMQSLAVSIGATLMTLPIVAYHFQTVSLYAVLGNMLVIPVLPFFLMGAIISLVTSFVTPLFGLVFSFVVRIVWVWMDTATRVVSSLPYAYMEEVEVSLVLVYGYYMILVLGIYILRNMSGRRWREVWA